MNCIITGGSGFIGTHLIAHLIKYDLAQEILVLDLQPPGLKLSNVKFIRWDIRNKIDIELKGYDLIFHLAALAKEPGFKWNEYFEINYNGTKNIIDFATNNRIKNIIFTSTMMVFKAGEKKYSEDDLKDPDTAYGISKLLSEEVLLGWKNSDEKNRLRIVRPGVVFGKGENGNFTRLANALQKNLFVYVGKKNTIKGSIYIKDLIKFLIFIIDDKKDKLIYNFVFPKPDSIQQICEDICAVMKWKRYIPTAPFKLMIFISYLFELLNALGIKNSIHHRRIEKLYYSTHLSADAVIASGFRFSYNLESALEDWKNECDGKGLF